MKEQKIDTLELQLIWETFESIYDTSEDEEPEPDIMQLCVAYYINGVPLLDMIREIEIPYCIDENIPELTADYKHNSRGWMKCQFADALNPDSIAYEDGVELFCCGACYRSDCWSVRCKIREDSDYIVMTDFDHNHHDWTYPLEFHFTKENFFAELKKLEEV